MAHLLWRRQLSPDAWLKMSIAGALSLPTFDIINATSYMVEALEEVQTQEGKVLKELKGKQWQWQNYAFWNVTKTDINDMRLMLERHS